MEHSNLRTLTNSTNAQYITIPFIPFFVCFCFQHNGVDINSAPNYMIIKFIFLLMGQDYLQVLMTSKTISKGN